MVTHEAIRGALRTALAAFMASLPEEIPVAFENRPFTKQENVTYFRESFKPQTSKLETLGPNGRVRHYGLYLLDCFFAAQPGTKDSDTTVGGLLTLFPPAKVIVYGGLTTTIVESSRAGGMNEPGWLMVPVTISWYADTTNPI